MVITYTGSLGVSATDMLYLNGLKLAELEPELKTRMREILPDYLNIRNPVDCSFSMTPAQVKALIEIGTESLNVQSFIIILQGEMMASFIGPVKSVDTQGKPILCCVACKEFMMDDVIKMEQAGVPVYSTSEMSAGVLGEMYRYAQRCNQHETKASTLPLTDEVVLVDNDPISELTTFGRAAPPAPGRAPRRARRRPRPIAPGRPHAQARAAGGRSDAGGLQDSWCA